MGLEDAFKALGLAAEFTPAAAIYTIFLAADRKASEPAQEAISKWTRGEDYRKLDLQSGIVGIFDHIYTSPLLRFRAFARSAAITAVIMIIWWSYLGFITFADLKELTTTPSEWAEAAALLLPIPLANIISDYISLFVVRKFLHKTGKTLLLPLLASAAAGSLIIIVFFSIANVTLEIITGAIAFAEAFQVDVSIWHIIFAWVDVVPKGGIVYPAIIVLLWLPLFMFGALGIRLLQIIRSAIGKTQWFIRDGNKHPIESVGLVAAILVFVATGAVHLTRWWIG